METTMYDTLLQLPLFQGLCQNDFTSILGKVKLHFSKHKAGEKIVRQGNKCDELVFLLKGEITSESNSQDIPFSYCEFFNAPYVIEPYSLFGMNTKYVSSYIAQTDVDIVTISKSFILSELSKYDIFRLNYLNIISNRSQILYDKTCRTALQDTESKMIHFITLRTEKPSGRKILKIKMDDFAQLIGETRLTISKVLNEMQEKGIVTLHRKEIEIPEIQRLTSY